MPWSTANEDLVELFETTGTVELAEILYDGTRSKGAGVVQFAQVPEAETAIAKFQQYMYGGRPLGKPILPREFTDHSLKYYTQTCVSTTDGTHSLQVLLRAVKLLPSPLTVPKPFVSSVLHRPCFCCLIIDHLSDPARQHLV